MDMLILTSAMITALGGMLALAFRVVRLPSSKARTRPQATGKRTSKLNPNDPTQVLLAHVTDEHKRHTQALREALDLRRARNEAEALTRLLNERILHTEAARKLGAFVQPAVGGRFRQWLDQARLDLMVDTVRREVAEVRLPAQTQPLTGERAFSRFITWMRGGPEVGAPQELVAYHRDQRQHYRLARAEARRIARERRTADAQTRLAAEQAYHLRVSRSLKRYGQTGDGADALGVTDPNLTAILN
ncbi:MAG TPA: hypothetical protein VF812_16355 [Ktedonobacterales bacterium]